MTQPQSIWRPLRLMFYYLISGISGFGWSLIWIFLSAGDQWQTVHTLFVNIAVGVVTGILVGSLMYPLYHRKNPAWMMLSAPLTLWLGTTCFIFLSTLFGEQITYYSVTNLLVFSSVTGFFAVVYPPFYLLNLVAFGNVLLMRFIIEKLSKPKQD